MSPFLAEMRSSSLARLIRARALESEQVLWCRAREAPCAPPLQLHADGFDAIAEYKLHSPAVGDLSGCTSSVETRVVEYALGGACAVSVLTESFRFGGSLDHLRRAAAVLARFSIPTMRKDFLLDPYQIMEARVAGAGGVLLIIRMLSSQQLDAMMDCAAQLDMFVLLEAFDTRDLAIARELLARSRAKNQSVLVGVNCRDLATLKVDPYRFAELASELPADVTAVAESGLLRPDEVGPVVELGYRLALIGSALMKVHDPRAQLAAFLTAGRRAARRLGSAVQSHGLQVSDSWAHLMKGLPEQQPIEQVEHL